MLRDVERLDTLIDHLLDAAKTLHRRARAGDGAMPLETILRNAVDTVVQRHGVPPGCVSLRAAEGLLVNGGRADLEIVFRNLVDNAVKYSLPDPQVDVTAERAAHGRAIVRVADNGPGIPPAERTRVFRRFARLGSELERSAPGTGLGLYLVKSIVRQLRGRVVVRDRSPEPGTVLEVDLPAVPPAEGPCSAAPVGPTASVAGQGG